MAIGNELETASDHAATWAVLDIWLLSMIKPTRPAFHIREQTLYRQRAMA
jgi:hypothetical protein